MKTSNAYNNRSVYGNFGVFILFCFPSGVGKCTHHTSSFQGNAIFVQKYKWWGKVAAL